MAVVFLAFFSAYWISLATAAVILGVLAAVAHWLLTFLATGLCRAPARAGRVSADHRREATSRGRSCPLPR